MLPLGEVRRTDARWRCPLPKADSTPTTIPHGDPGLLQRAAALAHVVPAASHPLLRPPVHVLEPAGLVLRPLVCVGVRLRQVLPVAQLAKVRSGFPPHASAALLDQSATRVFDRKF